jgi:hypothetical protein|tara:strand:- start:3898 stop:4932 length:1035 start_codon:yes stop_codon:yes gene_type:complete
MKNKVLVVGAGIFGMTTSIELAKLGMNVTLHEELNGVMNCASGINQYRLHQGYHYPRSKVTALECLKSIESFKQKYNQCIVNGNVDHYYSISKENSLISGKEYIQFLDDMGLFYKKVKPFKKSELTISVKEELFDPKIMKRFLLDDIDLYNVNLILNHKTLKKEFLDYDYVVISTYSKINELVENNREYQFEICEKPIVKLPREYNNKSIVVMDGPFMCLDPYGNSGFHVLGNVVHAIHSTNIGYKPIVNDNLKGYLNNGIIKNPKVTNIDKFIQTGKEYFDGFDELEHIGSMYTVRTVLSNREHDDARPTIVNRESDNIFTIFSGKIVTCVDATKQLIEVING